MDISKAIGHGDNSHNENNKNKDNNNNENNIIKIESIRCNICDEVLSPEEIQEHIGKRSHSIKKRVAEYNEMNTQLAKASPQDTSTIKSWIKSLYYRDYLSNKT